MVYVRQEARSEARKFGSRGMIGTNPDAIEAWAFDPVTLEALLRRLEPYGSVVLLSGDVHYSASTAMSYFTKGEAESRALRAVHQQRLQERDAVVHHDGRPQPGARAPDRAPAARRRAHGLVAQAVQSRSLLGDGKTEADIPREYRAKLRQEPTLLPTSAGRRTRRSIRRSGRTGRGAWSRSSTCAPDDERPAPIQVRKFDDPLDVEASLDRRRTGRARSKATRPWRRASSTRSRRCRTRGRSCSAATSGSCASSDAKACCTRSTRCTPARDDRRSGHRAAEAGAVRAARSGARRARCGAARRHAASSTKTEPA